ncbi:MAG: T9SS type A sorting domain-containing protein, partial [Candidatus Cloacimonadaceae bacterium]|nr:T9SS type A sorting domain-containing protein [Candidatus Cloacimonadaceae bacterium]
VFTNTHLDIVSTKASFTQDKLFFALKTNGTAYPVSSGLTYFSYMIILVDPDADPDSNPIVYGLMHTVNLGTLISPGLYKITGTGVNDLTRIGNIVSSVEPTTNTLVLSCDIADLTADADFMAWFDPAYPKAITSAITSRITLSGGTQQADMTDGAQLLLKQQAVPVADLSAPVLSQAEYSISADPAPMLYASILYSDADANFPRHASLSIDGGEQHDLMPDIINSLDFSQPVLYQLFNIPIATDWTAMTYRFSHANGIVEHTILNEVSNSDLISAPPLYSLYPNPAKDFISIEKRGKGGYPLTASLYNQKGQKLRDLLINDPALRIELGDLPPGLYFLRVSDAGVSQTKRFIKVK